MIALPAPYPECAAAAHQLLRDGDMEKARKLIEVLMSHNDEDPGVLWMQGYLAHGEERWAEALTFYKAALQAGMPEKARWLIYNNAAECLNRLWRLDEAIEWAKEACRRNPEEPACWRTLGFAYVWSAQADKAIEVLQKSLELSPGNRASYDNIALAYLLKRDWPNGWDAYEYSLGYKFRMEYQYVIKDEQGNVLGEPKKWGGEPGKVLVVSGEQGLGDEILFASCIPDAVNTSKKVLLECNLRLQGLFQRSFPEVDVHGTRYDVKPVWKTTPPNARSALGALPKFFRREDAAFPGEPYLVADPVRRAGRRAELRELGKRPNVGIAWTGGTKWTGQHFRHIPLEMWEPVLREDAHFIDLEYHARDTSGFPVHQFPWATLTYDYDDTAALVAELDLVIATCTSVVHLAGALGVETWVLVPEKPNWRFGPMPEERLIWTKSVKIFRQRPGGTWAGVMMRVAQALESFLSQSASRSARGTRRSTRKRRPRSASRPNGRDDSPESTLRP